MLHMAGQNVETAFQAVLDRDPKRLEGAEDTEEYIDYLASQG